MKKLNLTPEERAIHKRNVFRKWMEDPEVKERIRKYQRENRRLWRYGIRRRSFALQSRQGPVLIYEEELIKA